MLYFRIAVFIVSCYASIFGGLLTYEFYIEEVEHVYIQDARYRSTSMPTWKGHDVEIITDKGIFLVDDRYLRTMTVPLHATISYTPHHKIVKRVAYVNDWGTLEQVVLVDSSFAIACSFMVGISFLLILMTITPLYRILFTLYGIFTFLMCGLCLAFTLIWNFSYK